MLRIVRAKQRMKRFNWKLAIVTFLIVLALDAILQLVSLAGPQDGHVWDRYLGVPFWIINFPGFPLAQRLRDASDGRTIIILAFTICSLSALLWSVAAGYLLRRKCAPNESLRSTPR